MAIKVYDKVDLPKQLTDRLFQLLEDLVEDKGYEIESVEFLLRDLRAENWDEYETECF